MVAVALKAHYVGLVTGDTPPIYNRCFSFRKFGNEIQLIVFSIIQTSSSHSHTDRRAHTHTHAYIEFELYIYHYLFEARMEIKNT